MARKIKQKNIPFLCLGERRHEEENLMLELPPQLLPFPFIPLTGRRKQINTISKKGRRTTACSISCLISKDC